MGDKQLAESLHGSHGQFVVENWKEANPDKKINLSGEDVSDTLLEKSDLSGANLIGTNLSDACLNKAALNSVDATGADFTAATLHKTNMFCATLCGANLLDAEIFGADFSGADFTDAKVNQSPVEWATCKGLETCKGLDPAILLAAIACGYQINPRNRVKNNRSRIQPC